MRAWPVSEGCLALDSSSRMRSAGRKKSADAATTSPTHSAVCCMPSPLPLFTTGTLRLRDSPRRSAAHSRAGGHQLPPDQPDPATAADALHGMVQQDGTSAGALSVHSELAVVRRLGPEGGKETGLLQPA